MFRLFSNSFNASMYIYSKIYHNVESIHGMLVHWNEWSSLHRRPIARYYAAASTHRYSRNQVRRYARRIAKTQAELRGSMLSHLAPSSFFFGYVIEHLEPTPLHFQVVRPERVRLRLPPKGRAGDSAARRWLPWPPPPPLYAYLILRKTRRLFAYMLWPFSVFDGVWVSIPLRKFSSRKCVSSAC